MSQQVLHLDFIALAQQAGPSDREAIVSAAQGLANLPQVDAVGAIESDEASGSDFDLVVYYLLADFTALEPFGTDPQYTAFLQGTVAPRLRAFTGADVRLDEDWPGSEDYGACLALIAPEETYDWEVREALQEWRDAKPAEVTSLGLAVGEKQLYRGAALVFGDRGVVSSERGTPRFPATLVQGQARALS